MHFFYHCRILTYYTNKMPRAACRAHQWVFHVTLEQMCQGISKSFYAWRSYSRTRSIINIFYLWSVTVTLWVRNLGPARNTPSQSKQMCQGRLTCHCDLTLWAWNLGLTCNTLSHQSEQMCHGISKSFNTWRTIGLEKPIKMAAHMDVHTPDWGANWNDCRAICKQAQQKWLIVEFQFNTIFVLHSRQYNTTTRSQVPSYRA